MINPNRRTVVGAGLALSVGAGTGIASSQAAAAGQTWPPRAVLKHAGFKPWDQQRNPVRAPFEARLTLPSGQIQTLVEWLESRPTVLVLWATWCPPCMAEKPGQGVMQSRLIASGSRTRIKSLQAYDDKTLAQGRSMVQRLGGASLDLASASPALEKAFLDVFGKSPVEPDRTSLPAMLLLGPDGRELGRKIGMLPEGYWEKKTAFDFLSSLDRLTTS